MSASAGRRSASRCCKPPGRESDVRDDPLRPGRVALQPARRSGRSSATRASPPPKGGYINRGFNDIDWSDRTASNKQNQGGNDHGAKFDLNDDSVVVHRRLRRGRRHARQRTGAEGHQGRDPGSRRRATNRRTSSTTNGTASPSSPGRTCAPPRAAGGCTRTSPTCRPGSSRRSAARPRIGPAPRCASRSTNSRRAPPMATLPGANLLDWPITLGGSGALLRQGRGQDGRHRAPTASRGLPGNNNFKVLEAGANKLGYKEVPHRQHGDQFSQPRDGRGSCQQIGFCFQGCKSGAKWSTLYTEIPKGEATGNLEVRPNSHVAQIEHDAVRQGHRRRLFRQGRQAAATEGAHRRGRRQFDRKPAPAAELGVVQIPRRARQLLRPGRPQLHAPHDRFGLRRVRQAGAHVSRHHHGRDRARRGAHRSQARLRRRL